MVAVPETLVKGMTPSIGWINGNASQSFVYYYIHTKLPQIASQDQDKRARIRQLGSFSITGRG